MYTLKHTIQTHELFLPTTRAGSRERGYTPAEEPGGVLPITSLIADEQWSRCRSCSTQYSRVVAGGSAGSFFTCAQKSHYPPFHLISDIDLMSSFASMSDTTETTPDPKRFKREEIRKKLADGELQRCQRWVNADDFFGDRLLISALACIYLCLHSNHVSWYAGGFLNICRFSQSQ